MVCVPILYNLGREARGCYYEVAGSVKNFGLKFQVTAGATPYSRSIDCE